MSRKLIPKNVIAFYLVLQALGTAAWWILLLVDARSRDWFKPSDWPDETLLSFWLGDSILLVIGSVFAACLIRREHSSASLVLWALAATVWYPTLYCVVVSSLTNEAWLASAMMVGMAGITLSMATVYGTPTQQPASIREAGMKPWNALAWTLFQTAIFWGTFLVVIPLAIREFEANAGLSAFSHPGQAAASAICLAFFSGLGLWSGATMALVGCGTPLPTATAPTLVIRGPYRFLRNPMAVAGIGQGIAVGWFLGSPFVICYALSGAFVWHLFVRPHEEKDLQRRFGDDYSRYKDAVGLWIPRRVATRTAVAK